MDRQDFEQVVPELRLKLLKIALFYLADEEEAEDVVQDTLLKLWMTRTTRIRSLPLPLLKEG